VHARYLILGPLHRQPERLTGGGFFDLNLPTSLRLECVRDFVFQRQFAAEEIAAVRTSITPQPGVFFRSGAFRRLRPPQNSDGSSRLEVFATGSAAFRLSVHCLRAVAPGGGIGGDHQQSASLTGRRPEDWIGRRRRPMVESGGVHRAGAGQVAILGGMPWLAPDY